MKELPIFHMLQNKQTILTVIRVFYLMEKNPFSSELSNVTHSLNDTSKNLGFLSALMNYTVHKIKLITGN